jgi:hypothetical protein
VTPWGNKELKAQQKVDQVIQLYKAQVYARGYVEGVRYARNQVIEFLEAHDDLGDILTIEEVIKELQYWKLNTQPIRGLADGEMAPIYSMDESPDICQDCFGPDLCLVCERANRR